MDKQTVECQRALRLSARFVKSWRGKALLEKRGMNVERSSAHVLDGGAVRRTTLRCQENVQKRYSIAALGYTLSLVMLSFFGGGTVKHAIAGAEAELCGLLFDTRGAIEKLLELSADWIWKMLSRLAGGDMPSHWLVLPC
jgi:hypothetical protein